MQEAITEEHTDVKLEQYLDEIFPLQQTISLTSKTDLSLLFQNKMWASLRKCPWRCSASHSVFQDALTRLVHLTGSDFADEERTFNLLLQLIEQTKTKKRIIVFTAKTFTIQMPSYDEHALASTELVRILRKAIRTQLFGVTEDDPLPMRINFQQGGRIFFPICWWLVVKLPGRGPQPVIEPDFKVSMGRQQIPFLLGEVGVSDRLNYTKLKSKLWIEKGCRLVRSDLIFFCWIYRWSYLSLSKLTLILLSIGILLVCMLYYLALRKTKTNFDHPDNLLSFTSVRSYSNM